VADRIQKHLALQSTLLERAADTSEANTRFVMGWQDCPHHPNGCPPDA
jgi:hypothetical protein